MATNIATPALAPAPASPTTRRARFALKSLGLLVGLVGIAVIAVLSLRIGSLDLTTQDAWNALFNFDPASYEQTVVRSLRLPRTVVALSIGAALAVAGATMQAVTRNPLADPFILGISSGASFAIVTAVYYAGLSAPQEYIWFAFAGALGAAALVFAIGSAGSDGPTPVKLALSGVVISAALGAWTSALLLLDDETLDTVRFWLAGSVVNRDMETFGLVSWLLFAGSIFCIFMGHQLNVLNLGEDTAQALGMRTGRIRIVTSVAVVLMTAAAVAIAGPIGFVGLAVPHMMRAIVGIDYRWVLPYSFVYGAIFLTGADIVGRIITRPSELQVGIVTAFVGVPFLIYLARQRNVAD